MEGISLSSWEHSETYWNKFTLYIFSLYKFVLIAQSSVEWRSSEKDSAAGDFALFPNNSYYHLSDARIDKEKKQRQKKEGRNQARWYFPVKGHCISDRYKRSAIYSYTLAKCNYKPFSSLFSSEDFKFWKS